MKETIRRAGRTFLQTAVGYLATNLLLLLSETKDIFSLKDAMMGLVCASCAAGLAAVMNLPKRGADEKEKEE